MMPTHPIRTAVVGVGLAGTVFHLPLLVTLPDLFMVHTVVERDPQGGKAQQYALNPKVVGSYEDALADPEIELVGGIHRLLVVTFKQCCLGCHRYPKRYTLSFRKGGT